MQAKLQSTIEDLFKYCPGGFERFVSETNRRHKSLFGEYIQRNENGLRIIASVLIRAKGLDSVLLSDLMLCLDRMDAKRFLGENFCDMSNAELSRIFHLATIEPTSLMNETYLNCICEQNLRDELKIAMAERDESDKESNNER